MANLEFVAIGIFKEDGVIAGAVFDAQLRALDVFRAGFANHVGGLVHGFTARRPERDPVSVRLVVSLLGESEKIDRDAAFRLEQSPFVAALVDAKPDRWKDLRIKTLSVFAILYPKIDVIE